MGWKNWAQLLNEFINNHLITFLSFLSTGKQNYRNMSVGQNGDIYWINENVEEFFEFRIRK